MKASALSIIALMLALLFVSGCCSESDKAALRLYKEASQVMDMAKKGNGSYSEVLASYRSAKIQIDRILSEYPTSKVALGLSSGNSLISGYSLKQFRGLEASLVKVAQAEQCPFACALLVAETIESASDRSVAMSEIAGVYAEAGQLEQALQLLPEAYEVGRTKTWPDFRLLCTISGKYAEFGQLEQASRVLAETLHSARTVKRVYDEMPQNGLWAIPDIAVQYATIGDFDRALETTKIIRDPATETYRVLIAIAVKQAKSGQMKQAERYLSQALESAEKFEKNQSKYEKSKPFTAIAVGYAEIGQMDQAKLILSRALEKAMTMPASGNQSEAFANIAVNYAEWGDLSHALRVSEMVGNSGHKNRVLAAMTGPFARLGDFNEALKMVGAIDKWGAENKIRALAVIAREHALAGHADQAAQLMSEAMEITQTLKGGRSEALLAIASEYAKAGQKKPALQLMSQAYEAADTHKMELALGRSQTEYAPFVGIISSYRELDRMDMAKQLLSETLQQAMTIKQSGAKSKVLVKIADEYAELGHKDQALELLSQAHHAAMTYADSELDSGVLSALAISHAKVGDLDRSLKMADAIKPNETSAWAMASIAKSYAKLGYKVEAMKILSNLHAESKFWALMEMAGKPATAEDLDQALKVAMTLGDAGAKSRALVEIAGKHIENADTDKASQLRSEALEAAKTVGDEIDFLLECIAMRYADSGDLIKALEITNAIVDLELELESKSYVLGEIAVRIARLSENDKTLLREITHVVRPVSSLLK